MLKQSLQQKLQQKLSPQQIQLMKMVQLPTIAFEQRVQQELEENPALEEMDYASDDWQQEDEWKNDSDDNQTIEAEDINVDEYLSDDEIPSYKTSVNNYSSDDDEKTIPYAQGISFLTYLKGQLHTFKLNEDDFIIADFLIGSLEEDGYLRREISSIVDDLAFGANVYTKEEKLESLLVNYIQKLDPPGVGARNLEECLLIQLRLKTQTESVELAIKLLDEAFDMFAKKHFAKIIGKFNITKEELRDAISEIERLNPKPGKAYSGGNTRPVEHITPDFEIKIVEGDLQLSLNGRNVPELKVSNSYSDMLETYKNSKEKSEEQKRAVLFVKQKLDAAKWFIDAVNQRRNTLMITMQAIMEIQREYFLTGDETKLNPMILKDIAEKINMDISTVSRVANSKYVNTPYGTFLIKEFFSESMTNDDGEEVSTREIKRILQDLIENENTGKPLTDDALAKALKEKGYPIARRTVAKYREQLSIPVARLRKKI